MSVIRFISPIVAIAGTSGSGIVLPMVRSSSSSALALMLIVSQLTGQTTNSVASHRVADVLGRPYFSGNKILGSPPRQFRDFLVLWVDRAFTPSSNLDSGEAEKSLRRSLHPDAEGRIAIRGRVVFKGPRYPDGDGASKYLSYEFSKGYLIDLNGKPVKLIFDTVAVNGVSYDFEGEYQGTERNSDAPVRLQGSMRKVLGDQTSSDVKLRFHPYNIVM